MGVVRDACKAAEVGRSTAYDRRAKDPEFRQAWDEIIDATTDTLEREAYRRATLGVEEPIYYKGQEVGKVRRYSDTLLIFLLKGRKPDVYRDRFEHTGAGGGPIGHRLDLSGLSDEELEVLRRIKAKGERGGSGS